MTKWILSVALALLAFSSAAISQLKGDVIGTWKLVSSKDTTDKGVVKDSMDAIQQASLPTRRKAG